MCRYLISFEAGPPCSSSHHMLLTAPLSSSLLTCSPLNCGLLHSTSAPHHSSVLAPFTHYHFTVLHITLPKLVVETKLRRRALISPHLSELFSPCLAGERSCLHICQSSFHRVIRQESAHLAAFDGALFTMLFCRRALTPIRLVVWARQGHASRK